MHVGVKFGLTTGREAAELARKAEQLGYHSIWLSERVAVPLDKPHPYEPSIDPWIGLAFIAAATERLFLGTTVSQIALRDPVLMARELATLDILSHGRLIVGAGAGWVEAEFAATGSRLRHARQALDGVRAGAEAALDGAGRGLGRQALSTCRRSAWLSRTRPAARRSTWGPGVRRACAG
jgi:alkanesulfonate monooxygenase SsuD/methylene tetrahydromethanopterin reductase-like flavin-dependent oxidoreductase (luciferase family)